MCRFGVDLDQQVWIASKVTLARSSFLVAAAVQLLYSIFTYRDYEVLNHRMLETLIEKVNTMERKKAIPLDDDVDCSTWIDEDLSEEESFCKDPDFLLPEEVAENSVTTSAYSRKYDLHPHRLRQLS
ncbi:hypothetical protein MKX01_016252 [Papaver californicum]|nr:hypothetical protein MKX01_016252 [Papaver californicum]